MEERVDYRIQKTKRRLQLGLACLMRRKSVNQITVKELVSEAGINRSTFYLHYKDISDLLQETESELLKMIRRAGESYPAADTENNSVLCFFEEIFRIMDRNREIAGALMGAYGDAAFMSSIETCLKDYGREVLENRADGSSEEIKYFYSFCMLGCLGFVRTWLEEGQEISAEKAAKAAYQMVVSAMDTFCTKNKI